MKKQYENIMSDFEDFLRNHNTNIMESFHPHFKEAFWEMVINGGKRFRPNLLFSVVLAKKPKKIKDTFIVALALESLHTYSLIHDDLPAMDNSPLRRGHQTLHIKYNETSAILAGDALNTYAFYLIGKSHFKNKIKVKLNNSLSFGALKMVLGQACDCYFENTILQKDKLDFIHINKTANLIASALEMGGIIAELPKKEISSLYKFGITLGLYFQIRDDLLDTLENEKDIGKPTHNDTNKNSYVNLLGLENAKKAKEDLKNIIMERLAKIDKKISKNLEILLQAY
ncbi:geranyl transferase [Helicobacter sp. 16-1353]|uniref:polyprenyl synthetase family protein n=1 Tax=Helicobacter sp. 16-1353 TaxID=2004996 RepID=UPI000DCBC1B1|nr:polyprenyl synthetase family protein [Helicobacter sp. 16-1353]RAX54891.1 geranyl transferase [Helicobacter sp. 16-1353]